MAKSKKIRVILITLLLLGITSYSFANEVLPGGDTDRNPVLGINFFGGNDLGIEFEIDIALSSVISLAPRVGITDFDWFSPGISVRFGIIKGERPHGFWIGPSADFIIITNRGPLKEDAFVVAISGEFGWRYTFDFGLSLQAFTRWGYYFGDGNGLFWRLGIGAAYAF